MDYALYMNGVYEDGLREIVRCHHNEMHTVCYLQPHGSRIITRLRDDTPNQLDPVKLYISTSTDLSTIRYVASIVNWRHKESLTEQELVGMNEHISRHQPGEGSIYGEMNGKVLVNLIFVVGMTRLTSPWPVNKLKKIENNESLGIRTQPGSFSYVHQLIENIENEKGFEVQVYGRSALEKELEAGVANALESSDASRRSRLNKADKIPVRIAIKFNGFRRNADVIAEVLKRAKGRCEECYRDAPFKKRSNGDPYLEVHHKIMLSAGGEDTIENAIAVCPNCHRKLHFG